MNATGGRLLELLESTNGRLDEAAAKLAAEYEVDYEAIAVERG